MLKGYVTDVESILEDILNLEKVSYRAEARLDTIEITLKVGNMVSTFFIHESVIVKYRDYPGFRSEVIEVVRTMLITMILNNCLV